MTDALEERLKSCARSFDSLLSLIPAKAYYGEDVSDQWKRKKQTPEQKRAARIAKLDPDNWKSAKDVMDERAATALKRKRDEGEDLSDDATHPPEKSKAEQDQDNNKLKRRKIEIGHSKEPKLEPSKQDKGAENDEDRRLRKAAQKDAQRERKQAKQARLKEKKEKQKAKKRDLRASRPRKRRESTNAGKIGSEREDDDEGELAEAVEIDGVTATNLGNAQFDVQSTASPSEDERSSILSPQLHSGTSSISSIQPTQALEIVPKPKIDTREAQSPSVLQSTEKTTQTPKERFEARLLQLRADRKADGPDGRPARNRQELLEQRRKKEEERKAAKKEQRRKEKEEEARREDEEIARRFSPGGSGSLLASPRSPMVEASNSFSFGRVAFNDGTQADAALSTVLEQRKRKGPADPASALKAAQNKALRLSGLDEAKRETIEQQDMWLNARKKAHGQRVRDDTSLLKKALKRREGEKRKSEKEWEKRGEGVRFGQEKRQQRREENIQKRKDEKGNKGKKNKVKRPGFEGSFRGRTGGGKGKKKNQT